MLVSVLVGAIRGVAEYTCEPAELLANLNERLVGRAGGGFSTALVAHIGAMGTVAVVRFARSVTTAGPMTTRCRG